MSDAPKDRDALIEVMHSSLIDNLQHGGGLRLVCESILTALESSGCFVGPVVATDKMMVRGGFSFAGRVPNADVFPAVRKLWDDMQSANPYRKE